MRPSQLDDVEAVSALFEPLFRPENLVLFTRINATVSALVAPVLTKIITRGVAKGIFDTFDPEGAADMILHSIVHTALNADRPERMDEAIQALKRRIRLHEIALARILLA